VNAGAAAGPIPSLDLRDLDTGHPTRTRFLEDLRTAAHEVGFFYLEGHGIDERWNEELFRVAREFFALPDGAKAAISMVNSPHFRGYTQLGGERTLGRCDWREQVDIGPERDALRECAGQPPWLRLQGPNQWPNGLPAFRRVTLRWQAAARHVLIRLLRAFAAALGQSEAALEFFYRDEPHVMMKLIRYPGRESAGDTQGVGAHKDAELLTLLLQDEQCGLQVKPALGHWIDVPPRTGTFVVNVGELLELASDGYLRATLHRAISPPPGRERYSAACFLGAGLNVTLPVLDLPQELASKARGSERDPANPLFREVGRNYLKGRLRSHPDVARRHHPDLLEGAAPSESQSPEDPRG
jgi:isopenicillin N synthase-like dioxygenase